MDVLVRHLPREAAMHHVVAPGTVWSPEAYLLAAAVDALAGANWQRGGGKGRRPKPVPRPGVKPCEQKYGKAKSHVEVRKILDNWGR